MIYLQGKNLKNNNKNTKNKDLLNIQKRRQTMTKITLQHSNHTEKQITIHEVIRHIPIDPIITVWLLLRLFEYARAS